MIRTCYRCMKGFNPKEEDPSTLFDMHVFMWGELFHSSLNGYLCKDCTTKMLDFLYELHAKENMTEEEVERMSEK